MVDDYINFYKQYNSKQLLYYAAINAKEYCHAFYEQFSNDFDNDDDYYEACSTLFALAIAEDEHYYQSEHDVLSKILTKEGLHHARLYANYIVRQDKFLGTLINESCFLDHLPLSAKRNAIKFVVCYFYLTGGITTSRRNYLYKQFNEFF